MKVGARNRKIAGIITLCKEASHKLNTARQALARALPGINIAKAHALYDKCWSAKLVQDACEQANKVIASLPDKIIQDIGEGREFHTEILDWSRYCQGRELTSLLIKNHSRKLGFWVTLNFGDEDYKSFMFHWQEPRPW